MESRLIGWDIGGAHLKAVLVNDLGDILSAKQTPCPLWQGLDRLDAALDLLTDTLGLTQYTHHAITMTGELADNFENREQGVMAITDLMARRFGTERVRVFAGHSGFLMADHVSKANVPEIASANWLASGLWGATRLEQALFIDIGSTTTDLLPIRAHRVENRGYTDHERMRYDELLYTGVARTPAMTVARRVPLNGGWINVMAEHFATTADVYRLTGELPEHADQLPAADNGAKNIAGSQKRLARLVGLDVDALSEGGWRQLAASLREHQLSAIHASIQLQLSRGLLDDSAPLLGAGVGRFLVRELANRFNRPFIDFSDLFSSATNLPEFSIADCGPAAAVACLALQDLQPA